MAERVPRPTDRVPAADPDHVYARRDRDGPTVTFYPSRLERLFPIGIVLVFTILMAAWAHQDGAEPAYAGLVLGAVLLAFVLFAKLFPSLYRLEIRRAGFTVYSGGIRSFVAWGSIKDFAIVKKDFAEFVGWRLHSGESAASPLSWLNRRHSGVDRVFQSHYGFGTGEFMMFMSAMLDIEVRAGFLDQAASKQNADHDG